MAVSRISAETISLETIIEYNALSGLIQISMKRLLMERLNDKTFTDCVRVFLYFLIV